MSSGYLPSDPLRYALPTLPPALTDVLPQGMFVSESKFRDSPRSFIPFIQTPNPQVLESLITKPAVEAALLIRLAKKANWYGQELGPDGEVVGAGEGKIDVAEVVRLYRDYIIPLTKDVEVRRPARFGAELMDPGRVSAA